MTWHYHEIELHNDHLQRCYPAVCPACWARTPLLRRNGRLPGPVPLNSLHFVSELLNCTWSDIGPAARILDAPQKEDCQHRTLPVHCLSMSQRYWFVGSQSGCRSERRGSGSEQGGGGRVLAAAEVHVGKTDDHITISSFVKFLPALLLASKLVPVSGTDPRRIYAIWPGRFHRLR